jgi:hypothetical protein
MKSIFYLLTAAIVGSTALVIYGVVTDDIRDFCFGITGLVMSVPAAVLLADELDKRRV